MAYNLIVTDRADELIDYRVAYILNKLMNPTAAKHLLYGINEIYISKDAYLRSRGYKEAHISDMQYKIIFRVDENKNYVYVVGLFHDLEDYGSKVID